MIIAGVDEAGRGPLAGPVVACALILPEGCIIHGVDDSKKLSEKRRNELMPRIQEEALAYGFGIIDAETIDRVNILQATLRAMHQAVMNLKIKPDTVLVDGTQAPSEKTYHWVCIPRGDANNHLIAAASILAKVRRDSIMYELHELYPEYGFDKHKGYGTRFHFQALREYGPCPLHRKSFIKKFI